MFLSLVAMISFIAKKSFFNKADVECIKAIYAEFDSLRSYVKFILKYHKKFKLLKRLVLSDDECDHDEYLFSTWVNMDFTLKEMLIIGTEINSSGRNVAIIIAYLCMCDINFISLSFDNVKEFVSGSELEEAILFITEEYQCDWISSIIRKTQC